MNRTITIIVGIFFSMIILVTILWKIPAAMDKAEENNIDNLQAKKVGNSLMVTWETRESTVGRLYYSLNSIDMEKADYEFSNTHKLIADNISGTVTFYIESCNVIGNCAYSKEQEITI